MRCWLVWSVVAALCATAPAQNLPDGRTQSPSPLPASLLRALGSADFAQREAAQRTLDDLPLDQRDALAQLATAVADPEAQARLLARVDAMDDELAIHPPLMSLDVKDASPEQLALALSKSMNIPMKASAPGHDGDRFTLSVQNAPFWDVFYQLHKQHPITFNRDGLGGWILYDDGGKADTPLEIDKGFLVEVSRATPRALPSGGLQLIGGPAGQLIAVDTSPRFPGGLALTFRLTAEPRMNIQSMKFSVQDDPRDDEGRALAVVSATQAAGKANDISWSATVLIGTPAHVGKTIKSLKVNAVMTAAVDPQRVVVDDPERMIDKPIQVGHATFTIRRFSSAAGQASYGVALAAGATGASICVIDANGERIAPSDFANAPAGGVSVTSAAGKAPFKLELNAARTTKEVTLPMEWHNIPIDGQPAATAVVQGGNLIVRPGAAIGGGDIIMGGGIIWIPEGGVAAPAQPARAQPPAQIRIDQPPLQPQAGPVPTRRF